MRHAECQLCGKHFTTSGMTDRGEDARDTIKIVGHWAVRHWSSEYGRKLLSWAKRHILKELVLAMLDIAIAGIWYLFWPIGKLCWLVGMLYED